MNAIEQQIKNYSDSERRMVVNKISGRFGFVHDSNSAKNTIEIFYPYPKPEILTERDSNLDFCALDGEEFKYI